MAQTLPRTVWVIAERYPPRTNVHLDDLADMLSAAVVLLYREFIRAMFASP